MTGVLLIRWTIRLSMACYALYLVFCSTSEASPRRDSILRALWTTGCGLCAAHFVVAFHFAHGWSHSHALEDTARQTRELMGWEFGEGIYFSYLFLIVWIADCVWWWVRPAAYAARPRWLSGVVHIYILFIAINGTMVFEGGVTRWAGLGTVVVLVAIAIFNRIPSRTVHRP